MTIERWTQEKREAMVPTLTVILNRNLRPSGEHINEGHPYIKECVVFLLSQTPTLIERLCMDLNKPYPGQEM